MTKICPKCGGTLAVRTNSRDGRQFLGCSGWRDGCRYTESVVENGQQSISPTFVKPKAPPFVPSPEQALIIDDVINTSGHIMVNAGAGTGKSTTALNSITSFLNNNPDAITVYTCYNRSIAKDFAKRPDCPPNTSVSTMHSIGYRIIRTHFESVSDPTKDKTDMILNILAGQDHEIERIIADKEKGGNFVKLVNDLIKHAKSRLIDGSDPDQLQSICERFNLDTNGHKEKAFSLISTILDISKTFEMNGQLIINFDDMIWLPIIMGWEFPPCEFCVADEIQDFDAARRAFAMKIAGQDGRLLAVGDKNQAIYMFAGADSDGMDDLRQMMESSGKPVSHRTLTYTRRVPKSGVRYINKHHPEIPFNSFPDAPEGWIKDLAFDDLFEELEPGDMVESRTKAVLVRLFFKGIRQGHRICIVGQQEDVEALLSVIRGLKAKTIPQLLEKAEKARAKELTRLEKSAKGGKPNIHLIEATNDKYDIVREIAMGCKGIGEIEPTIRTMFADVTGPGKRDRIMLTTVHKAKGLEADRTFVLQENMPHLKASSPEEIQQETNIWYVAHTRHKEGMFLVH
jgi:DNA helicase II / ATP-dependent DNA helicase PcrA